MSKMMASIMMTVLAVAGCATHEHKQPFSEIKMQPSGYWSDGYWEKEVSMNRQTSADPIRVYRDSVRAEKMFFVGYEGIGSRPGGLLAARRAAMIGIERGYQCMSIYEEHVLSTHYVFPGADIADSGMRHYSGVISGGGISVKEYIIPRSRQLKNSDRFVKNAADLPGDGYYVAFRWTCEKNDLQGIFRTENHYLSKYDQPDKYPRLNFEEWVDIAGALDMLDAALYPIVGAPKRAESR